MDTVLFIDGFNSIHRACVKFGKPSPLPPDNYKYLPPENYTIPPTVDDSIIFTFNFFRNLRATIEQLSPDKCFFVLEGHPQFRYDLYSDYKANRIIKQASEKSQKSRDSFLKTKDIVLPLLKHLPITICLAEHYEADDVIATLCDNMRTEDLIILSNDSDYIQLLQRDYGNIRIYNPIKKQDMEAPSYPYVPWKCLNGDKSDNIPALLKPKKALDTILNPDLFKKFMDVEENRANFNINRQLIEFGKVPEEEIILQDGSTNFTELHNAFTKMQFESIINEKSWIKFCNTFNCIKY